MRSSLYVAAALLLVSATPSVAQSAPADPVVADPVVTTAPVEDDDNDFPWGLLGLIGLAGLLGRRKVDHVHTERRA